MGCSESRLDEKLFHISILDSCFLKNSSKDIKLKFSTAGFILQEFVTLDALVEAMEIQYCHYVIVKG
jgi:hypothetical protein